MEFEIQINDGSEVLPEFIAEENSKSIQLYDWQRRGIKYFFEHNCRSIFQCATGVGKSFFTIELIKEIWKKDPNCHVLIVVPKNVILEKTWHTELYDAGISLRDIGVFYGSIKEYAKVTITNMQSLKRVSLDLFDCVIFDEIHHFGTKRLLYYLKKRFKYMVGLSATTERSDMKHYDIYACFDYNIFKYTPKQALEEGILNPFVFYNIGVEMDSEAYERYIKLTKSINLLIKAGGGFNRIMRKNEPIKFKMLYLMTERKQLLNNYKRKFDVVLEICKKHKDDKIIIFNSYNEQTSKAYWKLIEHNFRAVVVHSGVKKEKREQNLTDFKNDKFNIMLATKILDEGYNLPKIDTAVIMGGDASSRQTIQRMGRVLRKKDKHSTLYQVYCCDTIEEEQGNERAKLFKDLASDFDDYKYDINDEKFEFT